jgi:thymidylate kinase
LPEHFGIQSGGSRADGLNRLARRLPRVPLGQKEFLVSLFRLLEEQGVCYCVLHSWESLPDELSSDLDLAIHPRDHAKLPSVFRTLVGKGYELIQCRNYAVGGYRFDFVWFESGGMRSAGIDVIDEYRQRGLILIAGEELVRNRQQFNCFWVANPGTEFAYILAKKTLKGTLPQHQAERLKVLVNELGKPRSLSIAGELFGEKWREQVVEACSSGTLGGLLGQLNKRLWLMKLRKDPLNPLRYFLCNVPRLIGRALKPSGLFLTILGPDGVGKSTLVGRLAESFAGTAFEHFRLYHWRPNLLAPQRETGAAVTNPHGAPPRGTLWSIMVLLGLLLDHWLGYTFVLRPFLARTGFVIFDRYYQDLLIDPKRYRYGGPRWLAEFVGRLIPKPDLILILDAPEQVTLSRKQEVPLEELQRQRNSYLQWPKRCSAACVIDAADVPLSVAERATRKILDHMEKRLKGRHLFWPCVEPKVAPRPMPDTQNGDGSDEGVLRSALDQFAMQSPGYIKAPGEKGPFLTRAETRISVSEKFMDQGICGPPIVGNTRCHHFVILPSRKKPRWLLPLGDVKKTRQGLEIYSPYGLTARLLQSGLARAIEMGWQGWAWPKVLIASEVPLALEALVHEVTGEDRPAFALSLGTPGRYRKLTVQVMRSNGDILGYIKLPLTRQATQRVRGEAQTLQRLCDFDGLRRHIPRVLYAGDWGDGYILFQSSRAYGRGPVVFSFPHEEFLKALWSVQPTAKPGQELVDEVQLEWRKVEPHSPAGWGELAERAFDRASRDLAGKALACGIGHGDFAPWNTRVGDGHLFVFDWEHAATGVPNLWDVCHFHVQVNSLLRPWTPKDPLLGRSPAERASFLLFVMSSVCRLLDEGTDRQDAITYRQRLLLRELG